MYALQFLKLYFTKKFKFYFYHSNIKAGYINIQLGFFGIWINILKINIKKA